MPMKQLFYGAVQAVQQLVQAHGIDLQMETQFTECRSVFLTAGFFRNRGRCRYILKSDSFRDSSKDLIFSADFHDISA